MVAAHRGDCLPRSVDRKSSPVRMVYQSDAEGAAGTELESEACMVVRELKEAVVAAEVSIAETPEPSTR